MQGQVKLSRDDRVGALLKRWRRGVSYFEAPQENLRGAVETKLDAIRQENAAKLDEMRRIQARHSEPRIFRVSWAKHGREKNQQVLKH
jgi:hypothetical protein